MNTEVHVRADMWIAVLYIQSVDRLKTRILRHTIGNRYRDLFCDVLFHKILYNKAHLLHMYLPDRYQIVYTLYVIEITTKFSHQKLAI